MYIKIIFNCLEKLRSGDGINYTLGFYECSIVRHMLYVILSRLEVFLIGPRQAARDSEKIVKPNIKKARGIFTH